MRKSVTIVGCGNIGRRHLQALAHVSIPLDILIVEPDHYSWESIEDLFRKTGATKHTVQFRESLDGPRVSADLAVLATGADVRRALFESLEDRHSIGAYLFEKVLFQSAADLSAVGCRLAAAGKNAWVNCGRRGFPGYQDLRASLVGMRELDMRVTGSGWGLCSNSVHFLDLYTFLTGHEVLSATGEHLSPGTIPSKREGNIELIGHLRCRVEHGGIVDIVCHASGAAPLTVEFLGPEIRLVIDEVGRTATKFLPRGQQETYPFESKFVSEMPFFYQDIIETGKCALPTYELSARQHGIVLDVIRKHLKLEQNARCPIT